VTAAALLRRPRRSSPPPHEVVGRGVATASGRRVGAVAVAEAGARGRRGWGRGTTVRHVRRCGGGEEVGRWGAAAAGGRRPVPPVVGGHWTTCWRRGAGASAVPHDGGSMSSWLPWRPCPLVLHVRTASSDAYRCFDRGAPTSVRPDAAAHVPATYHQWEAALVAATRIQ